METQIVTIDYRIGSPHWSRCNVCFAPFSPVHEWIDDTVSISHANRAINRHRTCTRMRGYLTVHRRRFFVLHGTELLRNNLVTTSTLARVENKWHCSNVRAYWKKELYREHATLGLDARRRNTRSGGKMSPQCVGSSSTHKICRNSSGSKTRDSNPEKFTIYIITSFGKL